MKDKIRELYRQGIEMLQKAQAEFERIEDEPERILTGLIKDWSKFELIVFERSNSIIGERLGKHDMQNYLASLVKNYIKSYDPSLEIAVIDKNYYPSEFGLFYEGYNIARFSIYDHKFISTWYTFKNPHEERLANAKDKVESLKKEIKKFEGYLLNPKSIREDYSGDSTASKALNWFVFHLKKEELLNFITKEKKRLDKELEYWEQELSRARDLYDFFCSAVKSPAILEEKYLFWKDKFCNEFGYTFEDRKHGAGSYSYDLYKRLGEKPNKLFKGNDEAGV